MKKLQTKIYNLQTNKGFTLIELLVVISIIGVLSSVVMVNVNKASMKARDARRMSDLKTIQQAIEFYYDNHGYYPVCNVYIDNGINDCLSVALIADGVIPIVPVDPLYGKDGVGAGGQDYQYYSTGSGNEYAIRSIFEGEPLKQNADYPNGSACDSGIYPTCSWYGTCVYRGYNPAGCDGLTQAYGSEY